MRYCGKCKNHVEATKTMELWSVPDGKPATLGLHLLTHAPLSQVLVLHLKRFSYSRYSRDKLETPVSFPLEGLDLSSRIRGPK